MTLVERVKNISLRPAAAWPQIAAEPTSVGALYAGYVAPLAAISPVALFIGLSVVGVSVPFVGTYRMPFPSGLSQAVVSFVLALIGVALMALVVNWLAPTFGGRRSLTDAFTLVGYSATPGFVAGVLSIFPPLAMLELLASLWSLYVFFVGVPIVMRTTREKALPYTVVTIACAFVLGIVLTAVMIPFAGIGRMALGGFGGGVSSAVAPADGETQAKAIAATIIGNAVGGGDSDKKQAAALVDGVAEAGKADAAGNDTTAQTQAGINVLKSLVTAGRAPVKPIPREELKALLPQTLAGRPRSGADSRTQTVAGIAASGASATYGDAAGGTIEVGIADLGNLGGLALLAKAGANLTSSDSDDGYSKNVDVDGRTVHEQWTAAGKHSELFEIVDNRFAVTATGSGVDMDTALAALGSIDVTRLAQLQR